MFIPYKAKHFGVLKDIVEVRQDSEYPDRAYLKLLEENGHSVITVPSDNVKLCRVSSYMDDNGLPLIEGDMLYAYTDYDKVSAEVVYDKSFEGLFIKMNLRQHLKYNDVLKFAKRMPYDFTLSRDGNSYITLDYLKESGRKIKFIKVINK